MLKTLTKADLIQAIQQENGFSLKRSSEIVESILGVIKGTLESGEDALISGFGKFCLKEKSERKGRNPYTGDEMQLRPRTVLTFKCSGKLRDKINGS
jgi:integration host factor subunit alpha